MDKLKMHTPNLVDSNVEKIAALFPNCVTEAQDENENLTKVVDFDLLRQELSNQLVEGDQERYRLDWPGKKEAILAANAPISKTLRPCREESVNFDKTQNLFIEGDNLDALKLLQENYLGKVKMIYIDPPYNTGNDFIYEDDFAESTDEFFKKSNQVDEEGNRLIANTESNGRFHSDWLSMMYSRLRLARNLLRDDGCILISIDDNEQNNIKNLLKEIFGESNEIGTFVVVRSEGGGLAKHLIKGHDFLYAFAKDINQFNPLLRPKDIRGQEVTLNGEQYWIEEDWLREVFGKYGTCAYHDIVKFHGETKKQEIDEGIKQNKYILLDKKGKTIVGRYRKISEDGSKFYSVIKHLNKNGVDDLHALSLDQYFSYPKPVSLLNDVILGASFYKNDKDSIFLDFFAGSATTAHAVMQLNAKDGGNRKFIMVQIPEETDKESEAHKAGYINIAEISKERIRRAGKKILEDNAIEQLDIGFRVLKVDSTNMKEVYYTPDTVRQADILDQISNIKEDRTAEDLLFQVMLDWGVELSLPIEQKTISSKQVFFIAGNTLVACFDEIDSTIVDEVAQAHPLRFVFAEKNVQHDHDKTNIKERFKLLSPETEVKVI